MLHVRARVILEYLVDVKNGKLPVDHATLREISSLCNRLPLMESEQFQEELVKVCVVVVVVFFVVFIFCFCFCFLFHFFAVADELARLCEYRSTTM